MKEQEREGKKDVKTTLENQKQPEIYVLFQLEKVMLSQQDRENNGAIDRFMGMRGGRDLGRGSPS